MQDLNHQQYSTLSSCFWCAMFLQLNVWSLESAATTTTTTTSSAHDADDADDDDADHEGDDDDDRPD